MKSFLVRRAVHEILLQAALATAVAAAPTLAAAADTEGQKQDAVEEVVVQGVRFQYNDAESALKMPLALKDTPQTVVVVTQDLMDFASIHQFSDIYKIDADGGVAHAGDQVPRNYYRGFREQTGGNFPSNSIKVDGFRMSGRTNLDLGLFDRFEVVKGATSTLYGQNSVGGTLNAISKKPLPEFGGAVAVEGGSYDHYRADVDFYGPLSKDERLSYRLVTSYLDEHEPVDFAYNKRFTFAPSVKFDITPNTSLLTRVSYQYSQFPYYFGYGLQFLGTNLDDPSQIVKSNFKFPSVPRTQESNMPWNKTKRNALFALTTLEHRFESDWNLRANVQYNHLTEYHNSGNATGITGADGLTGVSIYSLDDDDHVYSSEVNLYGDVELFGRKHTVFFGVDYAQLTKQSLFADDSKSGEELGFSILHPDYSLVPAHTKFADYSFFYGTKSRNIETGATAQMLLHPTDELTAILGARYSYDQMDQRNSCCDLTSSLGTNAHAVNSDVTYQTGLTYKVTPGANLYASYGQTYEPQSGTKPDGSLVKPETGDAYEVGAKGNLPGRKFSWSLALFDMERTHISESVQGTPYSQEAGTQRSRGAELELNGDFASGWNVFGSFAYLDAEYIDGAFKGAQPVNAPRFGASVFSSYELLGGPLKGLGFGGGVVHKEGFARRTVYTFSTGTVILPFGMVGDFTEVDARVFYHHDKWEYHIGVTNLFNTTYFTQHTDNFLAPYLINPPRMVTGRLTYHF